jgi:hypothetical protein
MWAGIPDSASILSLSADSTWSPIRFLYNAVPGDFRLTEENLCTLDPFSPAMAQLKEQRRRADRARDGRLAAGRTTASGTRTGFGRIAAGANDSFMFKAVRTAPAAACSRDTSGPVERSALPPASDRRLPLVTAR